MNPINLEEIPDTSENRFHNFLQELVDGKLIPSLFANEAKREFRKFVSDVVCENKVLFCNNDVRFLSLNGFYIEYLKYSIHYRSFAHVLKIVLTLFHGHANVEHGFSLKQLVVENMSETSLTAQQFVKNHMLLNVYHPHEMPIAKELI